MRLPRLRVEVRYGAVPALHHCSSHDRAIADRAIARSAVVDWVVGLGGAEVGIYYDRVRWILGRRASAITWPKFRTTIAAPTTSQLHVVLDQQHRDTKLGVDFTDELG